MRTGGRHLVVNLANLLLLLVVRPLVRRNRWYVSGGLAAPQIPADPPDAWIPPLHRFEMRLFGWLAA